MYWSIQTFKFGAFSQEDYRFFLFDRTVAVPYGKPKNFHEYLWLEEEHEICINNNNSCEKDIRFDWSFGYCWNNINIFSPERTYGLQYMSPISDVKFNT